jgi:hypothetical protein
MKTKTTPKKQKPYVIIRATNVPAMKVYRINDYEWWLANSLEEAIADVRQIYGKDFVHEQLDNPRECTNEEMDRLKYCDDGAMYGEDGSVERWECPLCHNKPRLTREWKWDGEKWEHDHAGRSEHVKLWMPCENTMVRTFREELQRTKDDGKPRMFATSEI